jgi:hypothetical protein
MSAGSEVRCSFVVACPQGCSESSVVLNAIRYQLGAFDELIVVESVPCDSGVGRELHIPLGTNDEDIMLVEGARKAVGDAVVVIEDHVVIGDGFVDALRKRLSDGVTEACTFAISNGTPRRIGARALFLFVSGLAGPSVEPALRERGNGANFAIRRSSVSDWLASDQASVRPAELRYQKVHEVQSRSISEVDHSLQVSHHQDVSLLGAALAIGLNAMRHGWLERETVLNPSDFARQRYFERTRNISKFNNTTRGVRTALRLLGACGWLGWWCGRKFGHVNIGRLMRLVHPPASK